MGALSLRLPDALERQLAQEASLSGVPRSQLIREALGQERLQLPWSRRCAGCWGWAESCRFVERASAGRRVQVFEQHEQVQWVCR